MCLLLQVNEQAYNITYNNYVFIENTNFVEVFSKKYWILNKFVLFSKQVIVVKTSSLMKFCFQL